jgi:hypothetical protein
MLDVAYLLIGVGFFLACWGLLALCEHLMER